MKLQFLFIYIYLAQPFLKVEYLAQPFLKVEYLAQPFKKVDFKLHSISEV